MALTGASHAEPMAQQLVIDEARHARPGLFGWIRRDPVRLTAIVLILAQLAWRADIGTRGYFSQDEWYIVTHATESPLDLQYLMGLFNNHLMPAGLLVAWWLAKFAGHTFWPYLLAMVAGQAILSIAFYRLLRNMFRPGWAMLVPLCVFLFSPLMLETTSLWVVALLIQPVLLSMVVSVNAQVSYMRTRRARHLIMLGASMVIGMLFSEKAVLVAPLVFLVTVCLYTKGGPIRSVLRALKTYWQSWFVLGIIAAAYTVIYSRLSVNAVVPRPKSVNEVIVFLEELTGRTTIPGLFGGPWQWWYAGDGPPLTDPPIYAVWTSLAALVVLMAVTMWQRRGGARAWTLVGLYYAMVALLLASTRLGNVLSPLAGWVARYVSDVVVVAAIALGFLLLGLRDRPPAPLKPLPLPKFGRIPAAAATVLSLAVFAVFGVGSMLSTANFRSNWDFKHGMTYMANAQADLANAPKEAVFFDEAVPGRVIEGYWYPYNQQSKFFLPAKYKPAFVTEAENPWVFDDNGHIHPGIVTGAGIQPGPVKDCGHLITDGKKTRLPLDVNVFVWPWVIEFGYLSSGTSTATLSLGGATREIQLKQGLNQIFLQMPESGGDAVEITVTDPKVAVCTNRLVVGKIKPKA